MNSFLFCFQNCLSLIRQSLKPYNFASKKKKNLSVRSAYARSSPACPCFLGFLSFFCFLIRKYASNFLYEFCFLKVNLCEMRYFKTIIFIVVRNGFEVLNSKQTVTMADYTFNYTVFSLSTNRRQINLSVDCPWDLNPQGWLPVPTPGSLGRALLFLPSSQSPRTSLSGGIGHLQRQTALATEERGLSEEPASPARVPSLKLPGDGRSHCCRLAKLPHLTFSFIS